MIQHVIERASDSKKSAKAEANCDDAHVLDAGVSHQPLHPCLSDDEQRGDEKGKTAQREDRAARQSRDSGRIGDGEVANDPDHGGIEQRARQKG